MITQNLHDATSVSARSYTEGEHSWISIEWQAPNGVALLELSWFHRNGPTFGAVLAQAINQAGGRPKAVEINPDIPF